MDHTWHHAFIYEESFERETEGIVEYNGCSQNEKA